MKGFIEVEIGNTTTLLDRSKNVYYSKRSIQVSQIIDFSDKCIITSQMVPCGHTDNVFSEAIYVEHSYEEIKQLIKEATQESDQDFLDKCAIAAMQGICVNAGRNSYSINKSDDISEDAYKLAKSMLQARKEANNG